MCAGAPGSEPGVLDGRSLYSSVRASPGGRDPATLPRRHPRAWITHIRPLDVAHPHASTLQARFGGVRCSLRCSRLRLAAHLAGEERVEQTGCLVLGTGEQVPVLIESDP